ncbi:hypothetical protein Tco_1085781, partial [Tanacetum coccineum]
IHTEMAKEDAAAQAEEAQEPNNLWKNADALREIPLRLKIFQVACAFHNEGRGRERVNHTWKGTSYIEIEATAAAYAIAFAAFFCALCFLVGLLLSVVDATAIVTIAMR